MENSVEERIYDWFLDELRVQGEEGEQLADGLTALRADGLLTREDALVALYDRLVREGRT